MENLLRKCCLIILRRMEKVVDSFNDHETIIRAIEIKFSRNDTRVFSKICPVHSKKIEFCGKFLDVYKDQKTV